MATGVKSFKTKFSEELAKYAAKYDIDTLSNPNDVNNLHTIIRNSIVIQELQEKLHELAENDAIKNAMDMKKLNDSVVSLTGLNIQLERQLSIDRKTRKTESESSVADYLDKLREMAKVFIDDDLRLQKVYCKKCNILVGRISGVYETTYYRVSFQCPQCQKSIVLERKERDYLFDVKDAEWRRPFPMEVIRPKVKTLEDAPDLVITPDLILTDEDEETENIP